MSLFFILLPAIFVLLVFINTLVTRVTVFWKVAEKEEIGSEIPQSYEPTSRSAQSLKFWEVRTQLWRFAGICGAWSEKHVLNALYVIQLIWFWQNLRKVYQFQCCHIQKRLNKFELTIELIWTKIPRKWQPYSIQAFSKYLIYILHCIF